jgi:membrane fusion protein, multidrug efflux system
MKRLLAGVGSLAALVLACEDPKVDGLPPQKAAKSELSPAVEVVPVEGRKLDAAVQLPGELAAYETVAIHPRVNAFVEDVLVDRGSRVKRGQLISRLSAPELVAQRAEAESKLLGTKSTYARLRAASETPGVVAKHDLEIAEATVKADEARLEALKTLEGYLQVRAPFDGVIIERNVHPGALVGPGSGGAQAAMLKMQSIDHLRLVVGVPEIDVGAIADGASAEFGVRTWPGERFSGKIVRVARSIEAKTRTMPVELDVDNRAGRLAPGMFAEVVWPVRRATPSLLVPPTAIVQTTERTFVDRVKGGFVEEVPVERGTVVSDKVEVFGALEVGDLVLRRGSEELRSGAAVQVKEESSKGVSSK